MSLNSGERRSFVAKMLGGSILLWSILIVAFLAIDAAILCGGIYLAITVLRAMGVAI